MSQRITQQLESFLWGAANLLRRPPTLATTSSASSRSSLTNAAAMFSTGRCKRHSRNRRVTVPNHGTTNGCRVKPPVQFSCPATATGPRRLQRKCLGCSLMQRMRKR